MNNYIGPGCSALEWQMASVRNQFGAAADRLGGIGRAGLMRRCGRPGGVALAADDLGQFVDGMLELGGAIGEFLSDASAFLGAGGAVLHGAIHLADGRVYLHDPLGLLV